MVELEKNPPNIIVGVANAGAIYVAVVKSFAHAETQRPILKAQKVKVAIMMYIYKNSMGECLNPTPQ